MRRHGWWLVAYSLWFLLATGYELQAQTTVNINDTLRNADNTLASGRLEIFWPAFKTADGFTVAPGRFSYTVTNGVVNLNLFPNTGGTPSGTSYRVDYYLTSGAGREYWVVPATGPVTIGDIRVSVAPAVAVGIGQLSAGSANQLFKTNTGGSAVEHAALTTGTAGTNFNVAFGAGTITLNLPDASATNRGAVTTGAQTIGGAKTLDSTLTLRAGATGAGSTPLKFQAGALMSAPEAHGLEWDGTNLYVTESGGTRKQLSSFGAQAANLIFAGPASGGPAQPAFRLLVDDDVPDTITLTNITQITARAITDTTGTLLETRGGTGQTTYTLGDTLYSSAADTLAKLAGNTSTDQTDFLYQQ